MFDNAKPYCLVTVTLTKGSTPRDKGAFMAVSFAGISGTIGGGNLEMQAIQKARIFLQTGAQTAFEQTYILGPDTEQCCGGSMELRYEMHVGALPQIPQTPVYLFGLGHVGSALSYALAPLPFDVHRFDNRADKNAAPIDDISSIIEAAPSNSFFIIMTHDHNLDYDITRAVLGRKTLAYCGLIGSKTKKARFLSRLKKHGLTHEQTARLTCPIGIERIKGKQPEFIAASITAQLLQKIGDINEH